MASLKNSPGMYALEQQDKKRCEELTSFLNVQYDNNVNELLLEADMALRSDLISLHIATETKGGKPLLESSLRQNYFTSLNELFEISIFDFDSKGRNLHQDNEVDYQTLNSIYYDDGGLQITERFFRVDPAKSKEVGGTGLGLAIVKHIVNQHRAEMTISSEINKGTEITLNFPIN